MRDGIETRRGLVLPAAALEERFIRGSGPGGQHRNVTASAVELVADLGRLAGPGAERVRRRLGPVATVRVDESRSQWRNRSTARQRLVDLLDEASTPAPPRRSTRPSRSARQRRIDDKRHQGEKKRRRAWRWGGD